VPANSLPLPTASDIADRVADAYAKLSHLTVNMTAWEEGFASDGRTEEPGLVLRAKAQMEPGRIRLQVFRPDDGALLLEFVDDGTKLTERTAEREITHPVRPTTQGRSLLLCDEAGFDGCFVGGLISSWLGTEPERSSMKSYVRVMRTARRVTADVVEGRPCYVIEADTGASGPNAVAAKHWLYVDRETSLVVKRVVRQTAFAADGSILQSITRTWVHEHALE
jgi:hypothetical protein